MSPLFPAEWFDVPAHRLGAPKFISAKLVVLYRFSRRKNAEQQAK